MAFSKKPPQAPQLDLTSLLAPLTNVSASLKTQFVNWKRYMEASNQYDGTGLRDVVNANAYALDALKDDHDKLDAREESDFRNLETRVSALETAPSVPFPASG